MTGRLEKDSARTLRLGGSTIHYHDQGAGPPLVMLQAFGPLPGTTAWLTYHKVVETLAQRFRCILLDYPNFGRSSPVVFREPVHDVYARTAFAVMDELGIESAPVLGVSTGGTVALDMALSAPVRVSRLVVGSCEMSTGGEPGMLSPYPSEVARLFAECQAGAATRERIRRLLQAIVFDASLVTDSMVEAMYRWRVDEPEHADAWSRSESEPHSNVGVLPTVAIPTLIVHGRQDRMVPLEQALRLATTVPGADLIVLNNCGHWIPFERPTDFLRYTVPFLTADVHVRSCGTAE